MSGSKYPLLMVKGFKYRLIEDATCFKAHLFRRQSENYIPFFPQLVTLDSSPIKLFSFCLELLSQPIPCLLFVTMSARHG